MKLFALVLVCLASASAFVAAPAGGMLAVRPAVAATPVDVTMGTMVKAKQRAAKSATRKIKCAHGSLPPFSTPLSLARLLTFFPPQQHRRSSRAAAKRFKVTATGKLLRHYAGKAHLLRKKRPQHLAKLRRVGCVDDAELDTYQRLLLVFPK